jgi:peptide/nickel transport system permease protein
MPMIQAGVLFIALVFVVVNLVTDIAVALLDPRTRKAA